MQDVFFCSQSMSSADCDCAAPTCLSGYRMAPETEAANRSPFQSGSTIRGVLPRSMQVVYDLTSITYFLGTI